MGGLRRALAMLAWLCAAPRAGAEGEPVTLRMATMAPVGTAWAREFNAFARDVEQQTNGARHGALGTEAIGPHILMRVLAILADYRVQSRR